MKSHQHASQSTYKKPKNKASQLERVTALLHVCVPGNCRTVLYLKANQILLVHSPPGPWQALAGRGW